MIKSYEVIRPLDFPYELIDFSFFFYNVETHIMNLHHAAGLDLVYEQKKMCYVFPQNEFYELLKLKNTEEPHASKYNWILMKGIFGGEPVFEATLNIENLDELLFVNLSEKKLNNKCLSLYHKPEPGNDIVISEQTNNAFLHYHLQCNSLAIVEPKSKLLVNAFYLGMSPDLRHIINSWFTEENKQMLLTENIS